MKSTFPAPEVTKAERNEMRIAAEIILLLLGLATAILSVIQSRLPRGILEWAVWIADITIIALRVAEI